MFYPFVLSALLIKIGTFWPSFQSCIGDW
jgi:hypothetical protein